MAELSPEAAKLLQARKDAIAELRDIDKVERTISDPTVIRLAGARLYEQGITMRVINGETVSAAEMKAATDMVQSARDAIPQDPLEVTLTIVRKCVGICPHCNAEIREEHLKPLPPVVEPKETLPARTADTASGDHGDANTQPSTVPPTNVVSLPERMHVSESAFHDRVLSNGEIAPLQKAQAVYSSPAHSYFGPGVLSEPAPDWSAHHPLLKPGGQR